MRLLKPLLFGVVFGAAIYFVTVFVLKTVFLLTVLAILTRMLFGGRRHFEHRLAFVDKIRNMSEEDYNKMKEQWQNHRGHHWRGAHRCNYNDKSVKDDTTETKEGKE